MYSQKIFSLPPVTKMPSVSTVREGLFCVCVPHPQTCKGSGIMDRHNITLSSDVRKEHGDWPWWPGFLVLALPLIVRSGLFFPLTGPYPHLYNGRIWSGHLQILADLIVLVVVSFPIERWGLPGRASTWVLKTIAVSRRHRSTVETFMLEREVASFSVRAGGFWVCLSLCNSGCSACLLKIAAGCESFQEKAFAWLGS